MWVNNCIQLVFSIEKDEVTQLKLFDQDKDGVVSEDEIKVS